MTHKKRLEKKRLLGLASVKSYWPRAGDRGFPVKYGLGRASLTRQNGVKYHERILAPSQLIPRASGGLTRVLADGVKGQAM